MTVAKPPEPIAPFGNLQLAAGMLDLFVRLLSLGNRGREMPARLIDEIPSPIALRMADPNAEVVADPASGE